jgi:hypothetical protein
MLQQVKGDSAGLHTSFNAKGKERRIGHTNGMIKGETDKRITETMTIKSGRQASSYNKLNTYKYSATYKQMRPETSLVNYILIQTMAPN